jgi:NhaA family Na+:H+ antiporter
VGKTVGVLGASWVATRLRVATLPAGTTWRHLLGLAIIAGIGFTVAIFIADLAFSAEHLVDSAKLGILVASILAGILGYLVLRTARSGPADASG